MRTQQDLYKFLQEYRQGKRFYPTNFAARPTEKQPYVVIILKTFDLIFTSETLIQDLHDFVKAYCQKDPEGAEEAEAMEAMIKDYISGMFHPISIK